MVPKIPRENPYIYRGPITDPDYFFGRVQETHSMLSRITTAEQPQSISIVGPRRIGKTSLLLHICRSASTVEPDFNSGRFYIFLDFQRKPKASQSDLYQWMWSEVLKVVGQRKKLPTRIESVQEFEKAVGRLYAADSKLTFLLDEFEEVAGNPQLDRCFFSHLSSLARPYSVSYVSSSRRPLFDLEYSSDDILESSYFNLFSLQRLGFLKQEEAMSLIVKPVQNMKGFAPYTQREINFLFDLAGRHPAFLQIACYHLFEHRMTEETWGDQAEEKIRREYDGEVFSLFRYAWRQLEASEKEAMILICRDQQDKVSDQLWESLADQCLVYDRQPFSSSFKRFVLQESTADAARELEQIYMETDTQFKARRSPPLLDLLISMLIILTMAGLVLSTLLRIPIFLYASGFILGIVVLLSLVRSYVIHS